MFKAIAEEHKEKQKEKRAQMKELETKIVDQSIPALSDAIFEDITKGSEEIVNNQKEIDRKCREVREQWQKFNNELGKWTTMVNDLDRAVKEIGDIRSWSIQIQSQIQSAVEQLDASK